MGKDVSFDDRDHTLDEQIEVMCRTKYSRFDRRRYPQCLAREPPS
jgi:hypothetical protein